MQLKFDSIVNSIVLNEEIPTNETVEVSLSLKKGIVDKLEKMSGVAIKELLERDINDPSEWFLDLYENDVLDSDDEESIEED